MAAGQQFYLGAQDATSNATEESALEFVVNRLMNRRTHVELVKVTAVTNTPGQLAAVGRVSVLPLVNEIDGYGNARPHQEVFGLCYFRYAGGTNAVLLDPQVGDVGLALVADKDTSVVKSTVAQANPGSRGRSRREYGVYLGLCLGNATIQQYISFTSGGIAIHDKNDNFITMDHDGITIQDDNGNSIAMSSSGVKVTTASLDVIGEVVAHSGGSGLGSNVHLSTHEHSEVSLGTDQSGPPVAGT